MSKELCKHTFPDDIEGIVLEINLRKVKWLLIGTYHPPSQNKDYFLRYIDRCLDVYTSFYDNFFLAGDLNIDVENPILKEFLDSHNAQSLISDKTCFKSLLNPSTIDLFITNSPKSFSSSCAVSSGLSDFHKMILTVMKSSIC